MAGLERAKAKGKRLGRPGAGFDLDRALEMRARSYSMRRIAQALGVPKSTIARAVPKTYRPRRLKTSHVAEGLLAGLGAP